MEYWKEVGIIFGITSVLPTIIIILGHYFGIIDLILYGYEG